MSVTTQTYTVKMVDASCETDQQIMGPSISSSEEMMEEDASIITDQGQDDDSDWQMDEGYISEHEDSDKELVPLFCYNKAHAL